MCRIDQSKVIMSEDIYIDVNYLTESERDIILQVLAKDEELRKQEKRRIRCVNFVWTDVWVVLNFHIVRAYVILPHRFVPCSCC